MNILVWTTNIWREITPFRREIMYDVTQLLPVAAFLFVSITPAQSLAFMQHLEAPRRPLQFVRDDMLPYMVFPRHTRSLASRLPNVTSHLAVGTAIKVLATAYSSTSDQTDASPTTTASGSHVRVGTLAANFLPFGTIVKIGGSLYTVEDRLNARYNGKSLVDLWFPSRSQALAFGVRVIEMEIVSLPQ